MALAVPLLIAQTTSRVTTVDPASGKVGDSVVVSGESLGKSHVSAVFLSDDKSDFKATLVEQSEDKITWKVPQVKPGDYNVSIQTGDAILIQPVRFTVE
ncbi:MAG TPA: IPT/TIG domain-containing protein [Candidatus Acidoferrales bacterium]|nr:IPT/TIG domain-containing protein [Candidatus Acidoferrales bacterium]